MSVMSELRSQITHYFVLVPVDVYGAAFFCCRIFRIPHYSRPTLRMLDNSQYVLA